MSRLATLDLNYLAVAEQKGAMIRELRLVTAIAGHNAGYRVSCNRIDSNGLVPGSATARLVIVAGGSLGSTELLLRCREQQTLPALSARLGMGWSSNCDFLTPAIHPFRQVDPSHGPTITAAINVLDHGADGQDVFIEEGGLPTMLERLPSPHGGESTHESVCADHRRESASVIEPEFAHRSRDALVRASARRRGRPFIPEQWQARS